MKKRFVLFTLFFFIFFSISVLTDCYAKGPATESETLAASVSMSGAIPVFRVDCVNKTKTAIGAALGIAFIKQFPDIGKKIDGFLKVSINTQKGFCKVWRRSEQLIAGLDQAFVDEVTGLGSVIAHGQDDILGDSELSMDELWVYQLIPDVVRSTDCSGYGVFGDSSTAGSPIVGRNLDWGANEDLLSMQAITVYEYGSKTIVNIGFAGYMATVSGFNSIGLFVAHLDSPMGYDYPDSLEGFQSAVFDMRKALEKTPEIQWSAPVQRAFMLMGDSKYAFSHNVLMADTEIVGVLECPSGANARLRKAFSPLEASFTWGRPDQIAVVNNFVLNGHLNPGPIHTPNYHEIFRAKFEYFRQLAVFDTSNKADVSSVQKIMFNDAIPPDLSKELCGESYCSIFNKYTIQSMVFLPEEKKLYLYTIPADGKHGPNPAMTEIENLLPRSQ